MFYTHVFPRATVASLFTSTFVPNDDLSSFFTSTVLVHHLFNKKGSLVGTKSFVHFFLKILVYRY